MRVTVSILQQIQLVSKMVTPFCCPFVRDPFLITRREPQLAECEFFGSVYSVSARPLLVWSYSAAFLGIWTCWSSCIFDVDGICLTFFEYNVVTRHGKILRASKVLSSLPLHYLSSMDWCWTELTQADSSSSAWKSSALQADSAKFGVSWVHVSNSADKLPGME